MSHEDRDKLLERNLSGDPPDPVFRARVLEDSLAALARRRRNHPWWRTTALSAAAVLMAGVSFLGGRYSVLRWETAAPPGNPPVAQGEGTAGGGARTTPSSAAGPVARAQRTVVVPGELVEWVKAARLFKQLGMQERVGRALDHAGRLMPVDAAGPGPVFAGGAGAGAGQEERAEEAHRPDWYESLTQMNMNRIVAHSLGD
jgi:hypothetical protein